ncbi:uncharacterized protein PGTG_06794 [Puccinia graminis f. sp. tritici CRL 75-36-700-3]|uniref:Retrotransposon Copia-like N-terminal domain-containing protein n=1 Tax=Puccinia graminis f. sp. tritici (strain CRL 75-36-700-3 / race SCCL) TaxID=418459 RepID=E3K966_PUCGT|nr:uncharacterized protein PGTG_06794 [Puccinia graminis f. sp. tritici CRL 75-36-700-3]EFP80838.2 hypothetical protein PGTG_06794 [Puccinia graminis f. sp. tritici CRL 75-36-700-3]
MANNTLNPLNPSINLIPKLEDTNFFEWKRTITGHLTAMGKLKYINSKVARPEDDAAAETFVQERAQVLQAIRLTIKLDSTDKFTLGHHGGVTGTHLDQLLPNTGQHITRISPIMSATEYMSQYLSCTK